MQNKYQICTSLSQFVLYFVKLLFYRKLYPPSDFRKNGTFLHKNLLKPKIFSILSFINFFQKKRRFLAVF